MPGEKSRATQEGWNQNQQQTKPEAKHELAALCGATKIKEI
jgi:hypothetical protein